MDQNSFPVQVSFGNDYDLDFTAIFAEVGNYTIVKTLGLISTEAALANYEAFLLDPSNDCLSPGNILSDCEGINYVEDGTFFPSNGADCASLLDVFRGDLSPGGQYFDNLLGGVEDPATVNDWLGGVGYAGPNVLAPDNSLVTTSDFATLEGLIDAAVENITIGSVAEGWNAFRDYWDLPEVQDHLFGTGSGDWGLHRYHPEYGHYEWCVDLQNSVPNNGQSSGEFDQSLLTYATTFDPWITELQNSNCPSQAANYQIVNADPYFSSTLGSRPVNGNGLNGKELMRELLCTYPEQSVQSLPTNTLWAAAVEAADAEVGGMATTAQVWEVFAAYYVQQKRRVMDLQKKNPCDSDKYSPFLFDASTANNAADLVADLPREHAFNYWGNSTYDVGSGTQPATGLHPVYDNWDQSCAIQTSSIAQVSTLLSNWSYGDNEQLRVTDERARGFMIRIPDMERVAQDLVDDGMNDGIFGESDDWTELEQMISNTNPCLNGASVLMAHSAYDIVFPTNASSIVIQLEKIIRYWDQQSSPADCIPINSDPWNCSNSVDFTVTYYSMEDFYWANQAFFDCMVATVNDFVSTPYDFQAVHTPTHFVISSPTHANLIPNGAVFTTYNNCTDCLENFGGSNSEGTSGGENGAASRSRSGNNLSNGQGLNATRSGACFEFWNPCDQIVPHCLCEDLQAATAQTASGTTAQIAALYAEEYGALPADWESFIDVLATQCNTIIYSATATEEAQVAAEELIEDLADGIVSLPTSPNAPAPIGLDCFTYEPDPCDEGQTIADYYNEQIYQDQFNALLEEFAQNYSANCLSPDEAPDALEMTYEDREYHFTLYYYSPEGNLYATVPPEGVRPISDADPTVFEQIANYRTNGWGSGFTVPQHRRNLGRANQLMTLYEYDSYNNPVVSQMPELRGTTTEMDNLPAYGQTQTIYDDLGRPRFSQDPRLEEETAVTYIRYDGQGRTIESGRLEWYQSLSDLTVHVNDQTFPDPALTALSERLFSYYDETNGFSPGVQENLRNRVVKTEYYESENALSHASHYDYDIQGNVKTLWQEDRNVRNPNGFIKRMDYTYGLVNGITYQFDYQAGQRDAYSHRYCYDDNNRLILSETSDGGGVWDVDQHNIYRYDGALARMEVGDYLVQGMDYVYTLQGWIKGVNSSANLPDRDLGNDGALSSTDPRNQLHRWLGRDAYAYTLHYNTTDYQSIHNFSATNRFYAEVTSANGVYFQGVDGPAPGLYNGNIAAMQTTLTKPDGQPEDYLLKGYYYDQLMRLRIARTAREPATAGTGNSVFINNAWEATAASTADYRVDLTYDRNGNIQSLQRNGYTAPGQSLAMDDLSYGYAGQNGFGLVNHQLNHVNDAIATSSYGTDLDDQNPNNYLYDRIGNLIRDNSEEIASIEWNIQGKVKRLTRSVGSQRPDLEYRYDSQGNRIEKIVKTKDGSGDLQPQYFWTSTHYVRDAQGNVLATYDKNYDRYSVDNATAIPDLSQFQNEVYLIRPGSGAQPPADAAGVPELILSNGQVPIGGTGNEYVEVMTWKEVHLYGSKRLGIEQKQSTVGLVAFTATVSASSGALVGTANREAFEVRVQEAVYGRTLGTKTYELANHLRNVLVVVSDRLLGRSADGLTVDGYEAQVLRSTDYYPFGMEMVGRTSGADAYRYGFNGKEDDRAWGNQLIQDYGFRLYNPAIAKFLSVDPLAPSYPMLTPYQFSSNRPIDGIDLEGLEYATVVYEIRYGSDEPSFRIEWHDDLQHNSYGRRGKGISVKTETYDENGSLISTSPTKFYKRSEKIALHSVDYGFYFGVTQVPEIKEIREYILTPVDAVDEAGRVHDRAYELVKANAKNATKSWATIEADEAFIIANKKVAARLVGDPDPFNQQPITLSEKKHARRAYQYFAWTRWNKIEAVSSWMMKNYSSIAKNDKGGFLGLNDIEENQLYNYEKFRDMYMYQDSNGDWLTKTDMWKTVGEGEDAYLVPKTVSELDSL
ncbi:MAG: RHS repeat-associated core domain-containing protein [Bacteroidota bacterium]